MIQSALAQHPRGVSEQYNFIPTTAVLSVLEKTGWQPVKASEKKVVNPENAGFQKHMIRLRQLEQSLVTFDKLFPEIVLINSHDGMSSFCFMMGLFRLVCSNGMVVADSMFGSIRVRHVGFDVQYVLDAVDSLLGSFPAVGQKVQQFHEIELTPNEQGVFAQAAAHLRWDDPSKIDTAQLVYPRRAEDRAPTLWNTFQRTQESLINGGRFVRNGRSMRRNKAVRVNGIDSNVRINKALWTLTEEMARLKGAA